MPESCAIQPCEPCQGRKAAALSSRLGVPRGYPGGATCGRTAYRISAKEWVRGILKKWQSHFFVFYKPFVIVICRRICQ